MKNSSFGPNIFCHQQYLLHLEKWVILQFAWSHNVVGMDLVVLSNSVLLKGIWEPYQNNFHFLQNIPHQIRCIPSVIPKHSYLQHPPKSKEISRWLASLKSPIFLLLQRGVTVASSAATLLTDLPTWKSTCAFTAERNPLFVHSATTLAIKLAGLESTCESSLEKSLIIGQ